MTIAADEAYRLLAAFADNGSYIAMNGYEKISDYTRMPKDSSGNLGLNLNDRLSSEVGEVFAEFALSISG